jgi:hypothetical protein
MRCPDRGGAKPLPAHQRHVRIQQFQESLDTATGEELLPSLRRRVDPHDFLKPSDEDIISMAVGQEWFGGFVLEYV